jgi:pyruvate kinase
VRQTKIIATVGPASDSIEVLDALVAAGVDVFRLNFSHGTHESHAEGYARIRDVARRAGRRVSILQDLAGPKIRTGPLAGEPLELTPGDRLVIGAGNGPSTPGNIFTPYAELVRAARPGDRLLLDDGRIELNVVEASSGQLTTVVVHGGWLGAHKGINAPGIALPPSALTAKDIDDLRVGLKLGVDLVALSFVQVAEDVARARDVISREGGVTPVIAKIERPAAVTNLTEILAVADAVMVARGDLGLEMPLEQIPRIQKEIIRASRSQGRPVIVATQVLESMRVDPRPTRAEVSDAANAVEEGADAIMLAGETAAGAFPVRSVQVLDAVIRDAELIMPLAHVLPAIDPTGSVHGRALSEAAVTLATTAKADAIVAVTHEGKTARLLSGLRPTAPILTATADERLAGALAVCWGVRPFITQERHVDRIKAELRERKLLPPGSLVVFINVSTEQDRLDANYLHLQRI